MPKIQLVKVVCPYDANNTLPKVRVAAYARVSTDSTEQETSYEAQVEYYSSYIKSHPEWIFVDVYADKGISGLDTKNRPEFTRMIADVEAKKIDLILVKSISRFSRNIVDVLKYVRILKSFNVKVFFEKEHLDSSDSKAEVLLSIMATLAQEESHSMSENIRWGIKRNMERGKVSFSYSRFLGYRRGDNGEILIDEAEAKIVRKIYELYLSGKSSNEIAKILTIDNIPTPGGKKNWSDVVVTSILTNEKYTGNALLQKTYSKSFLDKKKHINKGEMPQYYVCNSHPAIIDQATFDKVQEIYKTRSNKIRLNVNENEHIGKLICTKCDREMTKTCGREDHFWQCKKCGRIINIEKIRSNFLLAINNVLNNKIDIIKSMSEKLLTNKQVLSYCKERLSEAKNKYDILTNNNGADLTIDDRILKEKALIGIKQAKKNYKNAVQEDKETERILKTLNGLSGSVKVYSPELFRKSIYKVLVDDDELDYVFYGGHEERITISSISRLQ